MNESIFMYSIRQGMLSRLGRRSALLVAALVLASCASLPEEVDRPVSYAVTDTGATRLGQELQPLVDANPGLSGFRVLNEGADAFNVRLRMIRAADMSIDTQYYIWHTDLTGNAMYYHLLLAADRGVRVRILLDDLDTAGKDQMLHLIDAHPGVQVRLYNPFSNRSFRAGNFITDTDRVDHRMHTKTLTVDNMTTVFGGRNIGDEYFSAAEEVGFDDMDAIGVGPIVQEVSSQFDEFWNSEWVYPISAFEPEEPVTDEAVAAFRVELEQNMARVADSEYAGIVADIDATKGSGIDTDQLTWSTWKLAYDRPDNVEGGEISADTNLAPNLKSGMDKTRNELLIVSPYFVPGREFTDYLVSRVADGVSVKILTNSLQSNDVSLVHAGYMRYREDLVAGGVELYEFRADGGGVRGGAPGVESEKASLHAKFFGFDQRYLFVGSFNLDPRSRNLNTELGAYFESEEDAIRLSKVFSEDIMRFAYRLELDQEGELEWFTLSPEGELLRVDHEPDTSFWQRFNTRILSPIVPESEL